jgi:hypothetical protein
LRSANALILVLLAASSAAGKPSSPLAQPVMVAGHEDLDACLSTAFVKPLEPKGQGYLSVRAAPNIRAKEVDRLRSGHVVWDCDSGGKGEWIGIVYHPTQRSSDDMACDLGPSDTKRRPYRGNCRSGWVSAKYLINLAG